jgi:hypothetical protein
MLHPRKDGIEPQGAGRGAAICAGSGCYRLRGSSAEELPDCFVFWLKNRKQNTI